MTEERKKGKSIKLMLLIIGLLGMTAAVYGYIKDGSIANHIIEFICSASLLLGYYSIDQQTKTDN